jgi:type II secretion system protein J
MKLLLPSHRLLRAFTLIEVLLAVTIFAIVLAAINGVFYGAMRLRTKTTAAIEESLPLQQVLAILKRDLQGIVPPAGTLSGTLKSGTATSSMDQQGGTEIYTCTGVIDDTSPWASVQKVSYALRTATQSSRSGKDLVRLVTRNLLPTAQEEVEEQWLMTDVEQIQFYFYDGSAWRNSWDSTAETTVLPKAIKVQIDLAPKDTEPRRQAPIQLVVPVTVQANTNQTQASTGGQP